MAGKKGKVTSPRIAKLASKQPKKLEKWQVVLYLNL